MIILRSAMKRKRRKLSLDQSEAESFDKIALKEVSKRISKSSIVFNEKFKILYDRKTKKLILGDEQICGDSRRFKTLSAAQAILLKAFNRVLGKHKKILTVYDLLFDLDNSWNEKMILSVLRVLVKKRILEEGEIQMQDRKISIFKVR